MTVDIDEAEAALSIDVNDGRLELRLWLAAPAVRRHGRRCLDDMIAIVLAWSELLPEVLVANARAFPRPTDGLRYPRTRPLRIANRALDAVVEIVDRRSPAEGPLWGPDSLAIAAAPTPAGVTRIERGPLVVLRWIEDPSDLSAMADACSRHEQWLLPLVASRIAPGWNADGDLSSEAELPNLVEAPADAAALPALAATRRDAALVFPNRAAAIDGAPAARAAGFRSVLYRGADGNLWDPFPPGSWVIDEQAAH